MKVQTKVQSITLANGANHNIGPIDQSFVRVTGPSGVFNITGIAGGKAGMYLTLYNTVGFAMTITDESASSLAYNRISLNGTAAVTTTQGTVSFVYDDVAARWILVGQSA